MDDRQQGNVSKLQMHRRRKPFRKILERVADRHKGCRSVTSTKESYSLVIDFSYPNQVGAVTELFSEIRTLEKYEDKKLPGFDLESGVSGGEGRFVKICFNDDLAAQ